MNDELLITPPEFLASEKTLSPAIADAADSDRRLGVSDLESASLLLSHAVLYLSSEQRAGRCTSVRGNRMAITILCDCAEALAALERRESARVALDSWLAGARLSQS